MKNMFTKFMNSSVDLFLKIVLIIDFIGSCFACIVSFNLFTNILATIALVASVIGFFLICSEGKESTSLKDQTCSRNTINNSEKKM